MRNQKSWAAGLAGIGCGVVATVLLSGPPRAAVASSNDRYQDYVMCTGAVSSNGKAPTQQRHFDNNCVAFVAGQENLPRIEQYFLHKVRSGAGEPG